MEKISREKMQVREKVGKSRFTVFFKWFGAPEGRKVTSLKLRVRSQLARWEMKNCTPSWREAHFQVKMYKTRQIRTTFGSWDVEKVHAIGAKQISKSKCTKHARFVEKVHAVGAKQISKSKCTKHARFGPLFDVQMSKKCTPLNHISKSIVSKTGGSGHFWTFRCRPPPPPPQQGHARIAVPLFLRFLNIVYP